MTKYVLLAVMALAVAAPSFASATDAPAKTKTMKHHHGAKKEKAAKHKDKKAKKECKKSAAPEAPAAEVNK